MTTEAINTMPTPFMKHRVPRDRGSVHVREFPGSGPAFVLLHGFPDNSHIYDDLIPHLALAGRRTVTIDFLGFGSSDKPEGAQYSFTQQLGTVLFMHSRQGIGLRSTPPRRPPASCLNNVGKAVCRSGGSAPRVRDVRADPESRLPGFRSDQR